MAALVELQASLSTLNEYSFPASSNQGIEVGEKYHVDFDFSSGS